MVVRVSPVQSQVSRLVEGLPQLHARLDPVVSAQPGTSVDMDNDFLNAFAWAASLCMCTVSLARNPELVTSREAGSGCHQPAANSRPQEALHTQWLSHTPARRPLSIVAKTSSATIIETVSMGAWRTMGWSRSSSSVMAASAS